MQAKGHHQKAILTTGIARKRAIIAEKKILNAVGEQKTSFACRSIHL
jgi:hypothetical protein